MDRWMDGCLVGRKHAPFSFAIVVLSVCRVLRVVGRRPRFGFAPYEFKLSSCATACGTRRNDCCCCFSSMCLATYFPHLYTFRSFVRSLGRSPTIHIQDYNIIYVERTAIHALTDWMEWMAEWSRTSGNRRIYVQETETVKSDVFVLLPSPPAI